MPNWTKEQLDAIESRDGTILVSAAAGSGKTAVLVQRVVERLKNEEKPCSADRLLIVTFTRAATAQMKERIYREISSQVKNDPSNEHLKRQMIALPFANISTIDSFCNDIVRENFHSIDIAPDYTILDNSQLALMRDDAVSAVLDELYQEGSPLFSELVGLTANGADDSATAELITRLYDCSMAFARPSEYLEGLKSIYLSDAPLAELPWGRTIIEYAQSAVDYCILLCEKTKKTALEDKVVAEKYSGGISDMACRLDELKRLTQNGSWDEIKNAFSGIKFSSLGRLPSKYSSTQAELVKSNRKIITEQIKKIAALFCATESENKSDMQYLYPIVEKLIDAVNRYAELLSAEKKKANGYDFSDICHFALDLLVYYDEDGVAHRTELAEAFSQKFEEILVDEYQDVNDLQNTLFWAVSRDDSNLFTVGDVKQSIYRFRQAMPEIFLKRRASLNDYDNGNYPARITLDKNFRSRAGVTENINFLFSQLMSENVGSVEYDERESLKSGASYDEADFPEAELCILGNMEEKVGRDTEARFIAEKIRKIIDEGMSVKDGDGLRKATYRDFCILLRSASNGKADIYAKALAQNGIPSFVATKTGFFASPEISMMISLMRVTDNPIQDVPLLAVMMSPIFGFTADELARMRIKERKIPIYHCVRQSADEGDRKCIALLDTLNTLRMLSATLPCDSFLEEVYELTGFKSVALAMKDGAQRNANLNLLVEYAAKYEESGKRGLSGFIRFIDRIQERKSDLECASASSEAADAVQIMTIHKSKGLEFSICILADLNGVFNEDFTKSSVAYHPQLGICFERRDPKRKCKFPTVGKKAINIEEKIAGRSEEMRVLYVAMTRAKERLICVTRYGNPQKKLAALAAELGDERKICPFALLTKSSMADWIMLGFLRHPDAAVLWDSGSPTIFPAAKRMSFELVEELDKPYLEETTIPKAPADEELIAKIREKAEYNYPYAALANVSAKVSPSQLEPSAADIQRIATEKPQFLAKSSMSSASRGTATHKFMEFFDYSAEVLDVDGQIEKMLENHHLMPEEAAVLEREKLKKFFESDTAERIKRSPLLLREKKVTVGIRARDIYPQLRGADGDETIVVQGYVDCAFEEDGELIIVDYKTDRRIDDEELRRRYKNQLKLYEYALSRCMSKRVRETVIYSFELGRAISLE